MDDNQAKAYIESLIRESLEKNSFRNDNNSFNYERNVVPVGDNFCSEIVRIEYADNDQNRKTLIIKIAKTAKMYEYNRKLGFYERECIMYEYVIPEMNSLLKIQLAPKSYPSADREVMLLENLKESGYLTLPKILQLDFSKCAAAFEVLGKYHAASVKIQREYFQNDANVQAHLYDYDKTKLSFFKSVFYSLKEKFLDKLESMPQYEGTFKYSKDDFWSKIEECIAPKNNWLNVLNHGDYWSNNIMFHAETSAVKMIDFQRCIWCSPAFDITYLTITSMQFPVFKNYFENLITIYVRNFNESAEAMKISTRVNVADLKKDLRKFRYFGVIMIICFLPIVFCNTGGSELNETLYRKLMEEPLYVEKSNDWINYYVNKGIL